jgi:2-methylaconitate cis-trans-isomerase PrpF
MTLGYDGLMKTTRERADERREAKLEQMREQVANGSLVIRTMSDEERKQYPPPVAAPPKSRRY